MRSMLLFVAAAFSLALGACETNASGGVDLAQTIPGKTWSAEAIGGRDVVDGTKVTLKIENGRVSGKAGCNGYGGPVEINGDRIKFGALFSTKMACMGGGVMEQESRYLNLLQSVTHGEVRSNGALVLTTGDGQTLIFNAQ